MTKYNLNISDKLITDMTTLQFKKIVKEKVREEAFRELIESKNGHEKARGIEYKDWVGPQDYLVSSKFSNKLKKILFNMRCQTTKSFKNNFHTYYNGDILCPLSCNNEIDSQKHMLSCHSLTSLLKTDQRTLLNEVTYSDIFGTTNDQLNVTLVLQSLLKIRDRLLANRPGAGLPGQ